MQDPKFLPGDTAWTVMYVIGVKTEKCEACGSTHIASGDGAAVLEGKWEVHRCEIRYVNVIRTPSGLRYEYTMRASNEKHAENRLHATEEEAIAFKSFREIHEPNGPSWMHEERPHEGA